MRTHSRWIPRSRAGQMPDNDSIEQRLTDFYHRSRIAMNGPIPRWETPVGSVVREGWGRQLMLAGAAAAFILIVVGGARVLRENQPPAAGQKQAVTRPTASPGAFTGSCKLPLSWPDSSGQMTGGFVTFP